MVSEDKLIKQGIRLTDAWFEKFKKQIEHDLSLCETYEEFIERTKEYTTANILINSGYAAEMQSLITQILNNHRFQRASQRALIEETINNNVGHLIQDVGEEIKETVRDVVKEGYDEGLHPREIARNINGRIDSINSRRARTIARTEVKRTDTVANYVRHKEQGATGFNVQCRPDCCPLCAEDYAHKDPKKQQARLNRIAQMKRDKVDDPLVRGKGETIGGNVEFSMDDTLMLPPRHPNCRCTAMFVYGTVETEEPKTTTTTTEPTGYQLNNRENSFSKVEISQKALEKVIAHQKKRASAKIEWGNVVDLETGSMTYTEDIKGKKNQVTIPRPETHKGYGIIHNHPSQAGFSGADIYNTLSYQNQQACFATSEDGIWIARETEQATFSKSHYGIIDHSLNQIKSNMDAKSAEISHEIYREKYFHRLLNATTTKEINAIKREHRTDKDFRRRYGEWLLEEYGVGKRKDALIEIEFIPKEDFDNVKF